MSAISINKTTQLVENILKSADSRFKKFGYKKTTVGEIASDLRISKKTLYSVFSSKEEIIRETAWRETVEIMRKFNDTIPGDMMSDSLLLSLCRFIFIDRIKGGKEGLFWGIYSKDCNIRQAYLVALKRVISAVYGDGRRRGFFKQIEPGFAAEMIAGHIITATEYFHLSDNPVQMFDNALKMIADAVAHKDRIVFDAMG